MKQKKTFLILILIMCIGAFLRFYKLDWANGLFTHPDEYHIVASVNQLSFPSQMHPHFFSYGTVTIYLIYFTKELLKSFPSILNSFLIGRFYSALFSTLTIFIVYKICRTFLKTRFSLLAAFLVAITPGLIQQAHFATPESALTFFLFLCLFLLTKFIKSNKIFYLILASVSLGLALGVKISSIIFLLPLVISIIVKSFRNPFRLINFTIVSLMIVFITFYLVAPYVFLDYQAFKSSLDYEGGLAIGKIPVFYTRQFIHTIPVLFQLEKILPYALGPVLLVLAILGFAFLVVSIIKKYSHLGRWQAERMRSHDSSEVDSRIIFLIFVAFLSLFIPNAFLFAKWTRFIAPTFPFFAIFAVYLLQELWKKSQTLSYILGTILLIGTILWTTAFFSIYTNPDIRITASYWLESNTKPGSSFLVEGGNMIDLPLHGNFQRISLDFYNLENDPLIRERIVDALYTSNYFLVQSRRVFMNHQRLPTLYPKTARFYDALFAGKLGFEKIKEFHSYPKLAVGSWQLAVADEAAEETWSVFDHPVIRIFKKNAQLTRERYVKFLEK